MVCVSSEEHWAWGATLPMQYAEEDSQSRWECKVGGWERVGTALFSSLTVDSKETHFKNKLHRDPNLRQQSRSAYAYP